MHHCLRIGEIVSQIFYELDSHIYDTRMRFPRRIVHRSESALRTLAALARTCQAFREPALDVLWREIPDLFVMINHLIPAELLGYDEMGKVLVLRQEPHPDVWRALDPYVARIRVVGIPPPSGVIVRGLDPQTVLQPLQRHLAQDAVGGDILFPKLEHVVYQAFWEHELHSRLLLQPNLQVLQLPLMAYTMASQWNLSPPTDEHMVTAVGRSIHALSNHVQTALKKMDNLPLREVSVSIAHTDAPYFLAHIDPESLEAVNIHWEYLYSDAGSSGAVLQQLFAALSSLPKVKHVSVALDAEMEKMIHIVDGGPDNPQSQRLKGLADSSFELGTVLSLTTLRTLEIGIDVVFQVDEEFLLALAEKMPHLESLRLTPLLRAPFSFEYSAQDDSNDMLDIPNLDGLLAFVERCTKLTTLRLAVCASLSGGSPPRLDGNVTPSSCGVRTLELWTTALEPGLPDEVFVAFFVDAFPSLEEFCVVLPTSHPERDATLPRNEARARWERVAGDVSASLVHVQNFACI
ncbi:hypothetical protein TRAPUB_2553 [Trametes pubescens]|uniref:F-box domain-containing protein n=1 Tax=Trametes pubescens TaxID=154538 RepID=A0A1M2VG61_TRAPU|nr:hypothetical protein TRAPUB_2553 [Trametes pubescens]